MREKTLEGDFEFFERLGASIENGLVAGKYDERSTCVFLRAAATVTRRRIGKARMASLMREICADLDLVSDAPVAQRMKEQGSAARQSAKMFRAAFDLLMTLRPSMLSTLRTWHGRARLCVPKFRIFHPK